MTDNKNNKKPNAIMAFGRSFGRMVLRLFTPKRNKQMSVLEEEQLMSPGRVILRNFLHNRLALIGIVTFLLMTFLCFGLSSILPYDEFYNETTLGNIEPNLSFLSFPHALEKDGIKQASDGSYLFASGNSFSVAVSNANKLYVWGAKTAGVKDIPEDVLANVSNITLLDAGNKHIVVVYNDQNGKQQYYSWGSNNHQQGEIPVYDEAKDNLFRSERQQIQGYFENKENNQYQYQISLDLPEITFEVDNSNYAVDHQVTVTYHLDDPNKVISKMELCYGSSYANGTVLVNNLKLRQTLDPEVNTITLTLDPNKVYQFAIRYEFERLGQTSNGNTKGVAVSTGIPVPEGYMTVEAFSNLALLLKTISIDGIDKDPIVKILADYDYTTILTRSGKLLTWGSVDSNNNQLGYTIRSEVPVKDFDASTFNIIALRADNSVIVYGKGLAATGNGESEIKLISELAKPLSERSGEYNFEVKYVGVTMYNAFVVTTDNRIITWGDPNSGINQIPEGLSGKEITSIDAGLRHIVALTSDGKVFAWGKNDLKQLNVPRKATNIKEIEADFFQNYAVRNDGKIISWGNKGFLFGTDTEGRSLALRLIQGGKVSMTVGAIAVLISTTIGTIVGLLSGFYGGIIDNILMRFGEIINAFPFLPLAITLSAFIGTNMSPSNKMYLIMIILGVLSWPGLSRLIRGQILSEREKDFVTAAKALGIKEKHIIIRHILPSVINIIIVSTTLDYAGSLLTEAGLSFLGFGVQKPFPSWGNLLDDAKTMDSIEKYWWKWIMPAVFIIVTALSINLVGDGLQDAMDPKANER